jgi:hypothetical protein
MHHGSAAAIVFDDTIRTVMDHLAIQCNSLGYGGVAYQNSSFFATMRDCWIADWTTKGVTVSQSGSAHLFLGCCINSSEPAAIAAIETNTDGTTVIGGQMNVSRASDRAGVGILFNNISGATITGGLVIGVFVERDIGVKITGTTQAYRGVTVRDLRGRNTDVDVRLMIDFDRAIDCVLDQPQLITSTGTTNYVARFGSTATRCSVRGQGYLIGTVAKYDVDPAATQSHLILNGRTARTTKDLITQATNLTVLAEFMDDIGPVVRVNNGWTRQHMNINDDSFISFTPPGRWGILELGSDEVKTTFAIIGYECDATPAIIKHFGSANVEVTTGALTGTTGTDATITVSAADGLIYIENRFGSAVVFNVSMRNTIV